MTTQTTSKPRFFVLSFNCTESIYDRTTGQRVERFIDRAEAEAKCAELNASVYEDCPVCGGTGEIQKSASVHSSNGDGYGSTFQYCEDCPACDGTGEGELVQR